MKRSARTKQRRRGREGGGKRLPSRSLAVVEGAEVRWKGEAFVEGVQDKQDPPRRHEETEKTGRFAIERETGPSKDACATGAVLGEAGTVDTVRLASRLEAAGKCAD